MAECAKGLPVSLAVLVVLFGCICDYAARRAHARELPASYVLSA